MTRSVPPGTRVMVTDKDMIFSGPGVDVDTKPSKVIVPETRKIDNKKNEDQNLEVVSDERGRIASSGG